MYNSQIDKDSIEDPRGFSRSRHYHMDVDRETSDNPKGSRIPPLSMGRSTALRIVVRIDDMKGILLVAALMSALSSPLLWRKPNIWRSRQRQRLAMKRQTTTFSQRRRLTMASGRSTVSRFWMLRVKRHSTGETMGPFSAITWSSAGRQIRTGW